MRNTMRLLAMALLLGLAVRAEASTTFFYGGQSCQWMDMSSSFSGGMWNDFTGLVAYSANSSNTVATCPAFGLATNYITIDSAGIVVWDQMSTNDISCWVAVTNWDGTTYSGNTLYSCGTWGGCTATNRSLSFTGYATLAFGSSQLGSAVGPWYPLNISYTCYLGSYGVLSGYNLTVN